MAKTKGKQNKGWGMQIMMIFALLAAILFIPTTILLVVGMMPTIVAAVIDRKGGTRAITVGSLNLCGCIWFLLELWTTSHTSAHAVELILNPSVIIVMYASAGLGYMIDWALSGIVATIMIQRATSRLKAIRKRQEEMVERWGPEVKGEMLLDPEGFPLEDITAGDAPKPAR